MISNRAQLLPILFASALGLQNFYDTAFAQIRIGPQGPFRVQSTEKKTIPVPRPNAPKKISLTLDATSAPEPALKYVLYPRYRDLKPGNGAIFYYRAVVALKDIPKSHFKEFYEKNYNAWMSGRYVDLPRNKVRKFLVPLNEVFESVKIATHREKCDWSWRLRDISGTKAIAFLLPELQEMRQIARVLKLKIRLAIAERRYDDAIEDLKVGYKLAHDIAIPRTLINDLVGIAIASMLNEELRNLMASPGAPNLYWALQSLPRPLIDLNPAMQYELTLPLQMFSLLKDPEADGRTSAEWANLVTRAFSEFGRVQSLEGSGGGPSLRLSARLMATGLVLRGYPRAKRDLVEWGYDAKRVEAMPVGQVIAIHQYRIYEHTAHEFLKWNSLPYPQSLPGLQRSSQQLKAEGYLASGPRSREVIPIVSLLFPAVIQAKNAEVRLETRIAGLKVIEAIRIHAARNHGQLPRTLGEISAVPVPLNPATGKSFSYSLKGNTGILLVPAPTLEIRRGDWRLEISIRPR
ncbi:MAG: hypothetical protein Tsb009_35020 [Planctomycetaceae bacterium]